MLHHHPNSLPPYLCFFPWINNFFTQIPKFSIFNKRTYYWETAYLQPLLFVPRATLGRMTRKNCNFVWWWSRLVVLTCNEEKSYDTFATAINDAVAASITALSCCFYLGIFLLLLLLISQLLLLQQAIIITMR